MNCVPIPTQKVNPEYQGTASTSVEVISDTETANIHLKHDVQAGKQYCLYEETENFSLLIMQLNLLCPDRLFFFFHFSCVLCSRLSQLRKLDMG